MERGLGNSGRCPSKGWDALGKTNLEPKLSSIQGVGRSRANSSISELSSIQGVGRFGALGCCPSNGWDSLRVSDLDPKRRPSSGWDGSGKGYEKLGTLSIQGVGRPWLSRVILSTHLTISNRGLVVRPRGGAGHSVATYPSPLLPQND